MTDSSPSRARSIAWLQMHICVLVWGCTAVLGKLITLSALALVWWRMLLVATALLLFPRTWRTIRRMPRGLLLRYLGIGVVVGLHWLCFYGSVKLANASIAATTMALASVFIAFMEPWLLRRRFNPAELLLGLAIIPGVALVVGGTPARMYWGLVLGILSAAFVAVFGVLNKRYVQHTDSLTMTLLEMIGGWLVLCLLAPFIPGSDLHLPQGQDIWLMTILCLACTLLPFALSLKALRHLSAFGAQLAVNLEPVYAIVLSILLLGEQHELNGRFYLGVVIILAAVFAYPLLQRDAVIKPAAID
ncbi:MAG: DMT family transporter [Steroidobacteraceae bacterium]